MKKNLILFLLVINTLLTTVPADQSASVVIRSGKEVLVLPSGSFLTSISFETPPVSQLSADPIYFFTKSRISDVNEIITLLTNATTPEEQSKLENIIRTFAPAKKNFAVDRQTGTATLHVEKKSKILNVKQLLAFTKTECQKQNLSGFLGTNAQIIVTEETLTELIAILRKQ